MEDVGIEVRSCPICDCPLIFGADDVLDCINGDRPDHGGAEDDEEDGD
jgi:hypothetical protein